MEPAPVDMCAVGFGKGGQIRSRRIPDRAIDQHGGVIDILVSECRGGAAARAFFTRALTHGPSPVEVTADPAPVYPRVVDELAPVARHVPEQYANNSIETDHGRLKARLRCAA